MTVENYTEPDEMDEGFDEENDLDHPTEPFDPDEISINTKVIPIETFLRRMEQNTIKLNPDFQRKEVWNSEKRSQLIESLMLNIPLPMFYVSADEKSNFTVIDGLQRLSTIRSFILGDKYLETKDTNLKGEGFPLKGLEYWEEFEGLRFNQLPTHVVNRILETEFNFTIVNPGTPEEVKRNIFKRINTGGVRLSSQEIRNALYIGEGTKLIKKLSLLPAFTEATGGVSDKRMADKELILRFISFYVRNYTTYEKSVTSDSYLSETLIILNAHPSFETSRDIKKLLIKDRLNLSTIREFTFNQLEEDFTKGMNRSKELFGEHAFRSSTERSNRKARINKALFEIWGNLLAILSETEFSNILDRKQEFLQEYSTILNTLEFRQDTSKHSMLNTSVERRFSTVETLIKRFK